MKKIIVYHGTAFDNGTYTVEEALERLAYFKVND